MYRPCGRSDHCGGACGESAGNRGAVRSIGLPLLIVFIILLLNAANTVYAPNVEPLSSRERCRWTLCYGAALIAISALTFHFVWEE